MTFALRQTPVKAAGVPVPLAMPDQDFHQRFRDTAAPGVAAGGAPTAARVFVLGLPVLISLWLVQVSLGWFGVDGRLSAVEWMLAVGTGIACYWMAVSVAAALLGMFRRPVLAAQNVLGMVVPGQRVAILLPMYGEPARATIGAAVILLAAMAGRDHRHVFSLHVLSDSRDPDALLAERRAVHILRERHPGLSIHYRHRTENADFKSGNIRHWLRLSGAEFDAALVLDADSLMGRTTVLRLVDTLAADPACGLVQSLPSVLPGTSLWQRMQSFASQVYGANLGRGFAAWTGNEGNYLGHNAVLRIRAFAASAGLPHLTGPRPLGGVILSHDFVEAALLRRAGWGVRMVPEATDSHEETPPALPGYLRRDRRWCQGNMQHLRLLAMPGLHWVSRFHLLQGAVSYLSSVWWLCLLILWALLQQGAAVPGGSPGPSVSQSALAGVIAALLLGPKIVGVVAYLRASPPPKGRRAAFAVSLITEVLLAILLAPMLMVHQVRAVVMTLAGYDGGWAPHLAGRPGFRALTRFHAAETVIGTLLTGLVAAGLLSAWVLPVAVGLILTLPLSMIVACDVTRLRLFAPLVLR